MTGDGKRDGAWDGKRGGARSLPLFDALPELARRVPWCDLGLEPSPVQRLARLAPELDHDAIWLKRDDLVSRVYGGNKGRKLEFVLADAEERGADCVLAVGATGSHQCVATAAFARERGLRAVSAVAPQPVLPAVRRNLLLDLYFGSEFLVAPDFQTLGERVVERLRAEPRSYLVAPGASTPVGNLGFVDAALELAGQVERGELPEPSRIFVAGASAGTAAGLQVGLRLAGLGSRVHLVQVSDAQWCTPAIRARHEEELCELIGDARCRVSRGRGERQEAPIFDTSAFAPGYGIPTAEALAALRRLREREGLALDACYTAKAFAALWRYVERSGDAARRETLLFWHTADACVADGVARAGRASEARDATRRSPAREAVAGERERDFERARVLDSVDYRDLPAALHAIFEEPLPDFGLDAASLDVLRRLA